MNILKKSPEEIDAVIISKVNSFPKKGGKGSTGNTKWTEEELQLRDAVILDYLVTMSRERTAQEIAARWGVSMVSARRYVKDAVTRFAESFDDDYEHLKKVFLERCEHLYEEGLNDGQKDIATRALDMMGKGIGVYSEKKDINLQGSLYIDFDFE